jgi:hypothetical protein
MLPPRNRMVNSLSFKYISRSPKIFLLFLALEIISLWFLGRFEIDEYYHKVMIRDTGINGFGTVIAHDRGSGRSASTLDYKYFPTSNHLESHQAIISRYHEVSGENYRKYPIGSTIPIRTNPKDPTDTHLNVQGYWTNQRLFISNFLKFVLYGVMISMLWLGPWYLIVAYRNLDLGVGVGAARRIDAKTAAADEFFHRGPD